MLGVVALASFGVLSSAQDTIQAADLPSLRHLVERQEAVARVISGYAYGSGSAKRHGTVVRTGEAALAFVRESDPQGLSLLHFDVRVMPHEDGRFFKESQTLGYDGAISWHLTNSSQVEGIPESEIGYARATIKPGRSVEHANARYTGWCATLPGFYDQRGVRFSTVLATAEVPFRFATKDAGEIALLECMSRDGVTKDTWELRRSWRFALARYRQMQGATVLREIVVDEAVAVHPDFWFPTRFTMLLGDAGDLTDRREDAQVRDPAVSLTVDADVFAPRFPNGTSVYDVTTKTTMRVTASDDELALGIRAQGDAMRNLVRFEPPRRSMLLPIAGAGAGVLGVGLLVWWCRMRVRRPVPRSVRQRAKLAAGSLPPTLALVLGLADTLPGQEPWLLTGLVGYHADNCAVNAVALAGAFYGRDCPPAVVAAHLGCDEKRVQSASLAQIADALTELGLVATPFRVQTLDDVRQVASERHSIAILHVATGGDGHYYVVAPGQRGFVVANPTISTVDRPVEDEYVQRLARRFTGHGVLVGPPDPRVHSVWNLAVDESWTLRLGALAPTVATFVVPVVNASERALTLRESTSACGCFREATLVPDTIPGPERGELRVTVDGAQLGEDAAQQTVSLAFFDGSSTYERRLRLAGNRRHERTPASACVSPSLVRAEGTHEGVSFAFVTVVVPTNGQVVGWHGGEGLRVTASSVRGIDGGVAVRHKLEWLGSEGWVRFRVRDALGREAQPECYLRAMLVDGAAGPSLQSGGAIPEFDVQVGLPASVGR